MKRLHVYIEKKDAAERLREQLQNESQHKYYKEAELCIHELRRDFVKVVMDKSMLADMGLADWKDSLYLTDNPGFAALLCCGKYPVLVYRHQENEEDVFGGTEYAIEGFEDVTWDYFFKVWQRLTGKPWHILDTPRCIIRESTVEDLEAFYELYKEPSVTKYMENLFQDRQEEKAYLETYAKTVYRFYGFGMWTVVEKKTGQVIGRAGISMRDGYEDPELGFMIGVPWQRKGFAAEICENILEYAGEELGFSRVQALVRSGNKASEALLAKLGFVHQHQEKLQDGVYQLYLRTVAKE